ncbi:unnamed protein product [Pedinophyceae sp. YPF-701]|nr:unnamed protein product [Pedinophyceae sp. YPF-701]
MPVPEPGQPWHRGAMSSCSRRLRALRVGCERAQEEWRRARARFPRRSGSAGSPMQGRLTWKGRMVIAVAGGSAAALNSASGLRVMASASAGSPSAYDKYRSAGGAPGGFGDPKRRVTDILLACNVVVFVANIATQGLLFAYGAKINEFIAAGQFWRLVTPAFLHGNLMHLAFNSGFLNDIGPTVERLSGRKRFATIYFTGAVGGCLASYLFSSNPSVGASGALFGLAGALWVFCQRHKSDRRLYNPRFLQAFQDSINRTIMLNMLLGFVIPRVDNWGHAGGLVGGALGAWLLGPKWEIAWLKGRQGSVDNPPVRALSFTDPKILRALDKAKARQAAGPRLS